MIRETNEIFLSRSLLKKREFSRKVLTASSPEEVAHSFVESEDGEDEQLFVHSYFIPDGGSRFDYLFDQMAHEFKGEHIVFAYISSFGCFLIDKR